MNKMQFVVAVMMGEIAIRYATDAIERYRRKNRYALALALFLNTVFLVAVWYCLRDGGFW